MTPNSAESDKKGLVAAMLPRLKGAQVALGLLIILAVFFVLAPSFRRGSVFGGIVKQAAVLGILACGTTLVLVSGGLDLSVGSVLALLAVVVGDLMVLRGVAWPVAAAAGVGLGSLCGCVNGLIQVWTGVPPFIVTLGGRMAYRGLAEEVAAGKSLARFAPAFRALGAGYAGPICILAGSALVVYVFLSKTTLGFNAYAIGGNEEVARLSGVKVRRNRIIYYTLGGLFTGLAAVVQMAKLNYANSGFGQMWELYAIAAVVIGGTSLFGGMGGVWRTIVGVLTFQSIQVGLSHADVAPSRQKVTIGIIIILAVWLDVTQRRRAGKA